MKAEYNFSKAERGKFYDPKAVFNLPIYLERDVDEFIRKLADEKGKDVEFDITIQRLYTRREDNKDVKNENT